MIKKVLIYGNRKQDSMVWDVSTPKLQAKGFLALFNYLDETVGVYLDLTKDEQGWYETAKSGNAAYAETLLRERKNAEYEEWDIVEVE